MQSKDEMQQKDRDVVKRRNAVKRQQCSQKTKCIRRTEKNQNRKEEKRKVRIGAGITGMESAMKKRTSQGVNRRFSDMNSEAVSYGNSVWMQNGSRMQDRADAEREEKASGEVGDGAVSGERSEAEKIYQAAISGKPNPIENLIEAPKVPYGRLAKDGVICYNGVCFVCDEKTNSICLGDMTDKKKVLNIPLSGGGHLKVNRDSIGLLSKAAGMFTPEDLNLIMRAISQDTRLQALQKEIEDEEGKDDLKHFGKDTEKRDCRGRY